MNPKVEEHKSWSEVQRKFYNGRAHRRMWHAPNSAFVNNILARFIPFAGLQKQMKILEIGCGAGRYTIPLAQAGYQMTGLDISERMIEKLSEDLRRLQIFEHQCRLICGNFDALKVVAEKSFDAIVGFNVLHHLFDVRFSLGNLMPYLKEKGLMVFVEPNALNPLHVIDTLLDRGWSAEKKKFDSLPENVSSSMQGIQLTDVNFLRFGFFPPPCIDLYPQLLKSENVFERMIPSKILPYFMIKGTK